MQQEIDDLLTLGVVVEERAWRLGEQMLWMRRASPVDPADSGWSAGGSDEHPKWLIVSVGELVERDRSVVAVLRGQFGNDARRNQSTKQWHSGDYGT